MNSTILDCPIFRKNIGSHSPEAIAKATAPLPPTIMTQFPRDQFAKDLLETLLSPFGEVQTAKTIDAQVREIDVYFVPVDFRAR
ncbi:hypothetical protein [Chamaesiphon sp. VAR_48_metabat_135_sub]|uniref:hypothetical protein n=1 Tax=Chamaesiphon sp. VAR_48_metabat_135_sub TaxID=2964699 RepID=UPI002869FCC7|nr:hypothetical protein [Chamaesiphon sp. VAR_48_metabat_135_sub]